MFKRLYNWLKLKTLPSSILFKNRLFVERDSKHRRIMSNFGLTFRNSKWSEYAIKKITDHSFWSLTFTVSFFIHTIYNSVFATFYDIDKSTNMLKSTPVLNEFLNKSYKAPKDLRSPIFVAFLTNSKNSTNQINNL